MTDQKMIAAIFNDFMSLYRGTSQIGIQEICKKYENHRMLMGLLANLDEAAAIPVPQVIYDMISGMSRADVKNVFLIMHTDSVILGVFPRT